MYCGSNMAAPPLSLPVNAGHDFVLGAHAEVRQAPPPS